MAIDFETYMFTKFNGLTIIDRIQPENAIGEEGTRKLRGKKSRFRLRANVMQYRKQT